MRRKALARRLLAWLVAGGAAVLVGACGVPTEGPPTVITEVPGDLLAPAPRTTAPPTTPAAQGPFIYLVDGNGRLVPVPAGASGAEPAGSAAIVLTRLASGPDESERVSGLSTALSPSVSLTLTAVEDGRAVVEIESGTPAPAASRLPIGVGQVVLSLASIPGITSTTLTSNGVPIDAPLPSGVLTSQPLTAADYAVLIRPGRSR